mgnify:CR=1 FL=1
MSLLNNSNAISTGGDYNLENSLRFRSSASAYLSRTPATAGNRKTWTFSCWTKRGLLTGSQVIFSAANSGNSQFVDVTINGNNVFEIDILDSNSTRTIRVSTAVLRDPSAWYHIVLVIDTTQATAADRIKLYVNNELLTTSAGTGTFPNQNADTQVNATTGLHAIGRRQGAADRYYDAYLTEVNFVDGQALTPSDFGESNEDTGVWQPKKYTGTYGTNGFYLKGRGTDNSGNGNNWTENNLNTATSTATTYDIMTDVPTLTNANTANYPTFNPIAIGKATGGGSAYGAVDGNLLGGNTGSGGWAMTGTTMSIPAGSGKFYFEARVNTSGQNMSAGVQVENAPFVGDYIIGYNDPNGYGYANDGKKFNNNTGTSYGSSATVGDVIGIAVDASGATANLEFFKNGSSMGVAFSSIAGNLVPSFSSTANASRVAINFGQQPFAYTPPTGYLKLNTFNLPDSSIVDGSEHFVTALYTGTGSSRSIANTITDGSGIETGDPIQFQPDFTWIKQRNAVSSHRLFDVARGLSWTMSTSLTNAEHNETGGLTSFNSDGFTVVNDSYSNGSGSTYAAWNWKAGGTAVSNTDGDIASQVSANTTAGFSIVTFTGTQTNKTVGHGLGVAPEIIITKPTIVQNWVVGATSIGWTKYLHLNLTNAEGTSASPWNNTAPTNNVYSVGIAPDTNNNGNTMVAYCFASVEGYSKIGSYTGNGSADGPFIYTGFKPAWIMFRSTSLCNWVVVDAARSTYNVMDDSLYPNTSGSEITTITDVDFLSNGFKWRANLPNETNASGQTYIYMAFAEQPFKYANAR